MLLTRLGGRADLAMMPGAVRHVQPKGKSALACL
jgi:hypothetical protein